MAGCQIHLVYVGIAGSHIRTQFHGIVAIKDKEVYRADLERVIDAAQAGAIPADQKILHILPQEYIIDNQEGIKETCWACPACAWRPRSTWSPGGGECRAEYREMHSSLRPRGGGASSRATRVQLLGVDR